MSVSMTIFWSVAFLLAYVIAPVSLVWGWTRWVNRPRSWSFSAAASFLAFVLASFSAILGILTIAIGMSGAFELHYDVFYRIVDMGSLISVLGILVATGGLWRKSPLRWHALASAVATLGFWAVAFTWP